MLVVLVDLGALVSLLFLVGIVRSVLSIGFSVESECCFGSDFESV